MKKKMAAIGGLAAGLICLSACNGGGGGQLPHDNQIHPDLDQAFVSELFYRNDLGTLAPDPCVIQITDEESTEYGYYYLYGTTDPDMGYRAYRNKDLTGKWEDVTPIKNYLAFEAKPSHYAYGKGHFWAPEVIYEADEGKYYIFYSGAMEMKNKYTDYEEAHRMIGVAVADEPYGPFEPCGDPSKPIFDNDVMVAYMKSFGIKVGKFDGKDIFNCIDPHPYVAPDGTKYLYFVSEGTSYGSKSDIFVCEMEDWKTPKLDTLTQATRCGYYTVDEEWTDESGSNIPNYESGNGVNEGPYMYQKQQEDGSWKYYLTLSINGYADKSYSVVQAVGDSPMGPFRKLTEEEGGILLGCDWQRFDHVSGTGHHSFIPVDGELYMAYHEHVARQTGGYGERDVAVDKVVWTKNNNGDDVLYCNGPTWSLQPRIAKHSGYRNLAAEAEVKASTGSNVSALTDGLLSIYTNNTYVKEFEAQKTTTITLKFAEYKEVSAIMVYNSKTFEKSFVDVKRIEFDCNYDGQNCTAFIENLAFDWDFYKMETLKAMRPGGSAVAVFNPLLVKEIRITVELPKNRPDDIAIIDEETGYIIDQKSVAISEIVVLGK